MTTLIIRDYEQKDLAAVTGLTNQLGYPTTTAEMQLRMNAISEHAQHRTLVAVMDHRVVGYAGLTKGWYWEKNESFLRIQTLVVHQDHRKAGIGKQLLEAAAQHALTIGANDLLLNSGNRPERNAAHRFYPKMGFEATSTGYVKKIAR
ncbi:GNAT family N-acetyltransferase [Niabella sp. CC-SYL272]|uniref:GNAT family N-acetyltransferase n=1 Tax=Niabella agricola TaxID=2891571 RepID=UPI001F438B3B|nr:GNAT family N-acetyltransferase [Niabella agricola]MCF3111979.1 GNAT family N-acetyltransferase [Niabella agricola]